MSCSHHSEGVGETEWPHEPDIQELRRWALACFGRGSPRLNDEVECAVQLVRIAYWHRREQDNDLGSVEKPQAYLRAAFRHAFVRSFKKRGALSLQDAEAVEQVASLREPNPLDEASKYDDLDKIKSAIKRAVKEYPAEVRAVELHVSEGLSFREMARVLRISHSTARRDYEKGIVVIHRAMCDAPSSDADGVE